MRTCLNDCSVTFRETVGQPQILADNRGFLLDICEQALPRLRKQLFHGDNARRHGIAMGIECVGFNFELFVGFIEGRR